MESNEFEELTECCSCGAPLGGTEHDAFRVDDALVCYDCAVRRGGLYDTRQGRWVMEPDVSDLPQGHRSRPRDPKM